MTRRIDKRWRRLAPGALAGRKITFASTEEIEANPDIASEFMSAIFELDPGDYAISDESDILDFVPLDERKEKDVWARIATTYGLTQADVGTGRLVRIFEAIAARRSMQ
jgi:hypothetical protein